MSSYLVHEAASVCRGHRQLVQVRLGKYGGDTDHRQRRLPRNELDGAPRHGPQLDLFEGLIPGSVARFTDVNVLGSEAFRLQFEIILRREKKKKKGQKRGNDFLKGRLQHLVGFLDIVVVTFTNITTHLPWTLLMDTLL